MAKLSMEISVLDNGKIKTLVELLVKHSDSLPDELQGLILDLVDSDEFEVDQRVLMEKYDTDNAEVLVNGETASGVESVNLILKRVAVYSTYYGDIRPALAHDGKSFDIRYIYPDSLIIKDEAGNELFGW